MPMSTVLVINCIPISGEPSLGPVFVGYNKAYGGELKIAVVFPKLRITQTVYRILAKNVELVSNESVISELNNALRIYNDHHFI